MVPMLGMWPLTRRVLMVILIVQVYSLEYSHFYLNRIKPSISQTETSGTIYVLPLLSNRLLQ